MLLKFLCLTAAMLATGIETAYVPAETGGGDYLVRVEPDLVAGRSPYTFSSDVPADSRDVRRVCIYVADRWPATVERSVIEAAARPRPTAAGTMTAAESPAEESPAEERPWSLLIGTLVALFLSLGGNAYLGILLGGMRTRYLSLVRDRLPGLS
ncbi:MAG: hypothetical protein EBS83_00115 [Planctomycetia bacterium]|jgi:hypothetical protein|nr:hypothetical protein [Planctomycetia bacterium]NDH95251.1 hypothetical protein [Planctomycetia bacterium]